MVTYSKSARVDNRGALLDIDLTSSSDVFCNVFLTENGGTARPVTTETMHSEIKDKETDRILSVESHTLLDASLGKFAFKLPYSLFTEREDEQLSHETYLLDTNGVREPLMYGLLNIEARG